MRDEIARNYDRDRTYPPFFKHGREFFQRAKKGEPQAKLYTRIDGREVLLVDPMAIDPSGKTKIGSVVPNRDATRAAVGIYARGSEIQDFRIIDTTTGAQIGPIHHRPALVRLGARRGVCVRLAAHRRSRTRARSRIAAIGTSSARTGRPTSC